MTIITEADVEAEVGRRPTVRTSPLKRPEQSAATTARWFWNIGREAQLR